jgi:hypothetical protein
VQLGGLLGAFPVSVAGHATAERAGDVCRGSRCGGVSALPDDASLLEQGQKVQRARSRWLTLRNSEAVLKSGGYGPVCSARSPGRKAGTSTPKPGNPDGVGGHAEGLRRCGNAVGVGRVPPD